MSTSRWPHHLFSILFIKLIMLVCLFLPAIAYFEIHMMFYISPNELQNTIPSIMTIINIVKQTNPFQKEF